MTPAKLIALRMIADAPRGTTKHTTATRIAGRVAACLVREGLAVKRPVMWDRVVVPNSFEIHITPAGRKALKEST